MLRINQNNPRYSHKHVRFLNVVSLILVGCFHLLSANSVDAQSNDSSSLAKDLANPIASLISVPLQYNYDRGYGTADGNTNILNVQPVIPISLNDNWNLISRTIVPIRFQNDIVGNSGSQSGIGDTVQSLFFSPKKPTANGLIWGAGPVILIPTSTDSALGSGKWGGGPTAVGLFQKGPWTYGGLGNHIWSFEDSSVNTTFLQPFVSYTAPGAVTYGVNMEGTYNWNTDEWSVPVNFSVSKVTKLGSQLVSLGAGAGYYLESATGGPDGWRGRLTFTLLFPK